MADAVDRELDQHGRPVDAQGGGSLVGVGPVDGRDPGVGHPRDCRLEGLVEHLGSHIVLVSQPLGDILVALVVGVPKAVDRQDDSTSTDVMPDFSEHHCSPMCRLYVICDTHGRQDRYNYSTDVAVHVCTCQITHSTYVGND